MATFANLVLNEKTYTPSSYAQGVATWLYRGVRGIAVEFSPVTQRVYRASGPDGAYHSVHKLTVPVVAEADSACGCAGQLLYTNGVEAHAFFAPGSTTAEREDLYDRFCDLVLTDAFKETFLYLSPVIT